MFQIHQSNLSLYFLLTDFFKFFFSTFIQFLEPEREMHSWGARRFSSLSGCFTGGEYRWIFCCISIISMKYRSFEP